MNQHRLQEKRRKRQARRKDAQVRARRRSVHEARARAKKQVAPTALHGDGVQIVPDQFDAEAAPIRSARGS